MSFNLKYITGLLLAIIIALIILLQHSCNREGDLSNMLSQSKDTLHKVINKLGQELTTTMELNGSIGDLKKMNSQKDSTLKKLQDLVDKNTASATIIDNKTISSGSGKTSISIDPKGTIVKHDTISHIDSVFVYPTYKTNYKSSWDSVNIVAKKDSIKVNYVVYNEFEIKKEWVSKGFFKPKVLEIQVLNKNPNTVTLNLKSFTEAEPKKSHWIDWVIGGLIGGAGVWLLHK